MFFCRQIHSLPNFPVELVEHMYSKTVHGDHWKDTGFGNEVIYNGQPVQQSRFYNRWAPQPADAWVRQHVDGLTADCRVSYQEVSPGWQAVHTDNNKAFSLNYVIDTGGPNVITRWFREPGQAIVRYKTQGTRQTDDLRVIHYDGLELLASQELQPGCWYFMNTAVLHDVINITGIRRRITLGWPANSWIIREFMSI